MKRLIIILAGLTALSLHGAKLLPQWQIADRELSGYFSRETRALSEHCLNNLTTSNAWLEQLPQRRAELAEMLGLSPLPPRTDLKVTVTKRFEHDTFTVENLHFQSRPGLYVTANLYVPKNLTQPAPTILYVCGHSPVITNKVSYGTKAAYQHWGIWFARNGYVCMVIDTLESGEILGEHHGTYRAGMWWWNSRGYTPAGVECWNGVRALDYLSTRPEVDTNRFGITGRSGGGAYSWFVTAIDDRIKAAAPTAGITDSENYVVDGAVEGHCDCMFFVNTYRWDYPQLAALAAPRPLLICNTDDDNIFPLDGVVRLRDKVRRVYDLLGAGDKCGLVITPGPHKDTQELQVPVMRWFNRHLKGEETLVENAAVKLFSPQQLKVFDTLPGDAVNARINETFVSLNTSSTVPSDKAEWLTATRSWNSNLTTKVFAGAVERTLREFRIAEGESWKSFIRPLDHLEPVLGAPGNYRPRSSSSRFGRATPESWIRLSGVRTNGDWMAGDVSTTSKSGSFVRPVDGSIRRVVLRLTEAGPTSALTAPAEAAFTATFALRSIPAGTEVKKEVQFKRRFMLLGDTVHSEHVADIVALLLQFRTDKNYMNLPVRLEAEGGLAVSALYATLVLYVAGTKDESAPTKLPRSPRDNGLGGTVDELVLTHLPKSHTNGPDYLNVLRILDIPQAVAMASERGRVELRGANEADWQYPLQTAKNLGWEKNLRLTKE